MGQKIKKLTIILSLLLCLPLSAENKKVDLLESEVHAILIPGSGTYSKKISTQNKEAQQFFDQGLRLAWGFYFPESIASYFCLLYTSPSPRDQIGAPKPAYA